jgi:hypothetical protein
MKRRPQIAVVVLAEVVVLLGVLLLRWNVDQSAAGLLAGFGTMTVIALMLWTNRKVEKG